MESTECRRLFCEELPIPGKEHCIKHNDIRLCNKCNTNHPVVDGLCHTCIRKETQELYEWQRRQAEHHPFTNQISNRGSGSCSLTQV